MCFVTWPCPSFSRIIDMNVCSVIRSSPQFLCSSLTCNFLFFSSQIFIVNTAGNIRNLAMEKVAGSVLFPCRYVSNGCNATMPHTDKSSHEDGCEFRSVVNLVISVFMSLIRLWYIFISEQNLFATLTVMKNVKQIFYHYCDQVIGRLHIGVTLWK